MPLTNSQYDEIMRTYQQQQLKNRHYVEAHQNELYQKIPALKDIDDEISSVSIASAFSSLTNASSALDETDSLNKTIASLSKKKASLLKKFGYPADYLIPPYRCFDCQDTGYINGRPCHCLKQAEINLIYRQSHLEDVLQKENFNTFSLSVYSDKNTDPSLSKTARENARYALQVCQSFCENFKKDGGNILLYGDTGTGKTFLTHCIAGALMSQSFSVIYFTAYQIFGIFEKVAFGHDKSIGGDYENIFSCDLLIIDDLGTEMNNAFTASQLFLCLNERLLRHKSTVISTNLTLRRISESYSERTFSRISSQFTLIKLFGEDIRIKKKFDK